MGSIVNGLVVGALAAGYVAMQFGEGPEGLAAKARDYLSRAAGVRIEEAASGPRVATVVAPDPRNVPVLSQAAAEGAAPPEPSLKTRWAAFAAAPSPVPEGAEFPWRHCFSRAAASHDLPESLLLAVASGESGFDPAARSPRDAVGLMQIRWPQTGQHLGILREADLYDPCTNVDAGARYLRELMSQFDDDLHLSLAAYNYGPARISGDAIPEGARWYSHYIYQHLQKVIGNGHVPSSELLRPETDSPGGHRVLMRFNRAERARDFIRFLQARIPDLDVQQRSEALGQQEVVLLYRDHRERDRALASLAEAGLDALVAGADRSHTL